MKQPKIEAPTGGTGLSAGLYLLVAAVAFFPCLFLGQAYFDNDLLAQFGPWRAFLKDQLAQGHFPLWNPYLLGGQPFFADLQNMMLYPLNYLTLPFSVPMGLSAFFFLHMFLAALGMHLWLKSLGLSENACRVGALLFALSNFFWLEIIHPPVLAAFAWLPWLFYRLERLAKDPKPLNAFLGGFCFAMLFLCGSFQVTVGAFYGGLAYFIFRFFKSGARLPLRSLLVTALFLLWGALPLLGQLIPTMEFANLSDRHSPDAQSEKINSQLSLNPATLGQFFFPRFTLKEGQDMAVALQSDKDQPEFPLAADWGYLSIWLPFLVWGAWRARDKSLPVYLSTFAAVILVFCFGRYTPLHSLISSLLPGLSLMRVPYRFLYLYVLATAVLAALGWDFIFQASPRNSKMAFNWKSPLIYAFGLYLVCLWRPGQNWREILALGLGFIGFGLYSLSKQKIFGKALVLASLFLPLLLNGWADFVPGPSYNFDFKEKSKAVLAAADSVKPGRLIFLSDEMYYPIEVGGKKYALNYPQNAACALAIRNFGGYNPLVLQAKKDLGTAPSPIAMQFGAVGGVLTQKDHGPMTGFKLEAFPPYLLYQRLETPALAFGPPPLQCKLKKNEPDHQIFLVDLAKPGAVAFTETMYPGWKARVDGQPAVLSTFDHLLRTLNLTVGHHEIEFKFEPAWWTPIRIGLALWCFVTLIAFLGILRKNLFSLLQKIYYAIGGHGLGRIKPLRWAYEFIFKLFKPRSVMVQGHRMWLDDKDALELAVHGIYEPVETELLKRTLKPGQTFVDVGANIGYYTLLAARLVGPKGKVYAFEPDQSNFSLLVRNVRQNGYSNVVVVPRAVSSKSRVQRLFLSESNPGDHQLFDSKEGRKSVEVQTVALDDWFKKGNEKIDLIKMDIQGTEAGVLEGFRRLMRRNPRLKLVTEFWPYGLDRAGFSPSGYLQSLKKLGFKLWEVSEKDKTVKPARPADILRRCTPENRAYTNLFCVKG